MNTANRGFSRKGSEFETAREHVGGGGGSTGTVSNSMAASAARRKNIVAQRKTIVLDKVRNEAEKGADGKCKTPRI